MPHARYRGPPMTLSNMRAQGVCSLWAVCELCHHEAVISRPLWRCRAGARLRAAHGLHEVRHHRRACEAQLAGAASIRELNGQAVALANWRGYNSDGYAG